MATTLPLVLFVLATTGLSIITLIGFVFSDWHAGHQALGSMNRPTQPETHPAAARNDASLPSEALKAA